MKRFFHFKRSVKSTITCTVLASFLVQPVYALDTASITASSISPDCIDYKVTGICYWLLCTAWGCKVRTSVKVSHYVPDAVVSAYSNTGENPWSEMSFMGIPHSQAAGSGDSTTNHEDENTIAKFKDADVIGHPGVALFSLAGNYTCEGAGTPFMPYLIGTLDFLAWRQNIPEMVYPEALIPDYRDVGNMLFNLWGNLYPRGGFLHQTDDYRAGAVIAQRAGDVVTRTWQPHVYMPLLANKKDGYWPAGALVEGDASTGKWQDLAPRLSQSCNVFPHSASQPQAADGGYAWALWRPYSCCKRKGQTFLFSIDFNN